MPLPHHLQEVSATSQPYVSWADIYHRFIFSSCISLMCVRQLNYAIPVWSFRTTFAQLKSLDVLQAKVCRRLLKSAKITFDINESKSNLNRLCHLEFLLFYLSTSISTQNSPPPQKLIFNSHGRIFSSLFLQKTDALWNCLPPRLTTLDSLSEFKRHLRIHNAKYQFDCTRAPLMCNH